MDEDTPPAKPPLEFRRGRQAGSTPSAGRKHVPVDDALARMAGRVAERRRAMDEARAQSRDADETF
jgi:hypothetical protein